jgi:hypothetical protein
MVKIKKRKFTVDRSPYSIRKKENKILVFRYKKNTCETEEAMCSK